MGVKGQLTAYEYSHQEKRGEVNDLNDTELERKEAQTPGSNGKLGKEDGGASLY